MQDDDGENVSIRAERGAQNFSRGISLFYRNQNERRTALVELMSRETDTLVRFVHELMNFLISLINRNNKTTNTTTSIQQMKVCRISALGDDEYI